MQTAPQHQLIIAVDFRHEFIIAFINGKPTTEFQIELFTDGFQTAGGHQNIGDFISQ